MEETVLGLDLGTASIGWALIEGNVGESTNGYLQSMEDANLIALGVRSFEEPIEPKSKELKNLARRAARGLRRNTARRSQRKSHLKNLLISYQLLPTENLEQFFSLTDPYDLRNRALSEPLTPHELGRALYHLAQRRGFLSNRKTKGIGLSTEEFPELIALIEAEEQAALKGDEKAKSQDEKEEGVVMQAIAELQSKMTEAKTIGQYFSNLQKDKTRVRGRYTLRKMYEDEFELIWDTQKAHHPQLMSELRKAEIYSAIFFQRPLKVKFERSKCDLEPQKPVADRAHPAFQEFRTRQLINNIRVLTPKEIRPLTPEERETLFNLALTKAELKWPAVRTALKISKQPTTTLNYSEKHPSYPKGIPTLTTVVRLTNTLGDTYTRMTDEQKEKLYEKLIYSKTPTDLASYLLKSAKLTPEETFKLIKLTLETGPARYSLKAINNLLPGLREGLSEYHAKVKAGYLRADTPETLDKLALNDLPELRNGTVSKAIHEFRKLINAIVRTYGKPDRIHIELSRDLALPKGDYLELLKAQKEGQKLNEEAEREFKKLNHNANPSGDDTLKYRLWKEASGKDLYTGEYIPLERLWSSDYEIDHIIPYALCLDDSFKNKVVTHRNNNQRKGRNTAASAFADTIEDIVARAAELKVSKRKLTLLRRTNEEVSQEQQDFLTRQLNDTAYAARIVADLCRKLLPDINNQKRVLTFNGKHTAALRRDWGLNNLLDTPETQPSKPKEKDRGDHRHHAIDAAVIACTTIQAAQSISRANRYQTERTAAKDPFENERTGATLRNALKEALEDVIISHEPTRRLRGPLHEETGYGKRPDGTFTTRKAISSLTDGEIERILDKGLRDRVRAHKAQHGAIAGDFQFPDRNGELQTVRRAKITLRGSGSKLIKLDRAYFPSGNNYQILIFEDPTTAKRGFRIISLFEAVQLHHQRKPLETLIPPGQRLLFALCKNDIVRIEGERPGIYRVAKFSGEDTSPYLVVRPLHRADDHNEIRLRSTTALEDIAAMIEIDIVGRPTELVPHYLRKT